MITHPFLTVRMKSCSSLDSMLCFGKKRPHSVPIPYHVQADRLAILSYYGLTIDAPARANGSRPNGCVSVRLRRRPSRSLAPLSPPASHSDGGSCGGFSPPVSSADARAGVAASPWRMDGAGSRAVRRLERNPNWLFAIRNGRCNPGPARILGSPGNIARLALWSVIL